MNLLACMIPFTLCLTTYALHSSETYVYFNDDEYNITQPSQSSNTTNPITYNVSMQSKLLNEYHSKENSDEIKKIQDEVQNVLRQFDEFNETKPDGYNKTATITNNEPISNNITTDNIVSISSPSPSNSNELDASTSVMTKKTTKEDCNHGTTQSTNTLKHKLKQRQHSKQGESHGQRKRIHINSKRRHHKKMRNRTHRRRNTLTRIDYSIMLTNVARNRAQVIDQVKQSHSAKPTTCLTCSDEKLTEDEVQQIRRQMFLNKLAEKLRTTPLDMMALGKKRKIPKLPFNLTEETVQLNMQKYDNYYARDGIIPGMDLGRNNCIAKPTSGCYSFDIEDKIKGRVASAQLWIHKAADDNDTKPQTLVVYGLEKMKDQNKFWTRHQLQRVETSVSEGWVAINMTTIVTSWINQGQTTGMIAVRCETCNNTNYKTLYGAKESYLPLIIVKYGSTGSHSRSQRSTSDQCNPRLRCCKRSLQFNFRNIHMLTVLAPESLEIGYCTGSCDRVEGAEYDYSNTYLMQARRIVEEDPAMRTRLTPCCAPVQWRPASLLVHEGTNVVRKNIPGIIVDRCGCV